MKMHTVNLNLDINAHDHHETNAHDHRETNVKVLRLVIDGIRDAEFEQPQSFNDLDSWDLDMEHDSNER